MRRLRHPNIVLFQGAVLLANCSLQIVLEWVDGGTLREFLASDRGTESAPLLRDTALGFQYLHSFTPPVLHRDLKPSNVLVETVREPPVAKISDFGLSLVLHQDGKLRAGTARYMAPEVKMEMKYGTPADVYSFGVMVEDFLMAVDMLAHATTSHMVLRCLAVRCRNAVASDRAHVSEVLEAFDLQKEQSSAHFPSAERSAHSWSDLPMLPEPDGSLVRPSQDSQASLAAASDDGSGSTGSGSAPRVRSGSSEELCLASVFLSIPEGEEDQESDTFEGI